MTDDKNQPPGAGPPPVFAPPTAAPPERPASAYLVLALNLIVLVAAVWWVWHRFHNPTTAKPGDTATSSDVAAGKQPESPAASTRGDSGLMPANGVKPAELGWGRAPTTSGAGGTTVAKAQPAYDQQTLGMIAKTADAVGRLGVHLDTLRAVRGSYPSSNAADFGRNRGVEALSAALKKSGRDVELFGLAIGDTDADGRSELLDPWGRPLVYFSPDDYATSQQWGKDGGDAGASKNPATGEFAARMRFQLWSAGPNGLNENGGGDDIVSWEIRSGQ